MKFPRLRTADSPTDEADGAEALDTEVAASPGYTPAKGKPTPKRRESEARRRGPVAPPPRTQREAAKRARGNKDQRRSDAAVRRERMAAGDDRYLLARDKGPVRAYVRDIVDSRRHLAGLFMPLALLVLIAVISPVPAIQLYAEPATLVILVLIVVEMVYTAWKVVGRVRVKFPDATDRTMSLGWYTFTRASQIRKMRMPKPRVRPGDTV